MNVRTIFNIKQPGHKALEFVDVKNDRDVRLFIDPTLIEYLPNKFCKKANKIITDYMHTTVRAAQRRNDCELAKLVKYGREPTETNLGMSARKPHGRGASEELLMRIFLNARKKNVFENGMVSRIQEMSIFIENFDYDRLSDLITNILRKCLYEFTKDQCKKYGLELNTKQQDLGAYWDDTEHSWKKLVGRPYIVEEKQMLLVPKYIVRKQMIISVKHYIWKTILAERQDFHLQNQTSLVQKKYSKARGDYYEAPPKKELYEKEVKGKECKKYAYEYTVKHPDVIDKYRRSGYAQKEIEKYCLSDKELDEIVYGKKQELILWSSLLKDKC